MAAVVVAAVVGSELRCGGGGAAAARRRRTLWILAMSVPSSSGVASHEWKPPPSALPDHATMYQSPPCARRRGATPAVLSAIAAASRRDSELPSEVTVSLRECSATARERAHGCLSAQADLHGQSVDDLRAVPVSWSSTHAPHAGSAPSAAPTYSTLNVLEPPCPLTSWTSTSSTSTSAHVGSACTTRDAIASSAWSRFLRSPVLPRFNNGGSTIGFWPSELSSADSAESSS